MNLYNCILYFFSISI